MLKKLRTSNSLSLSQGFTLVELLVVITIIGVLATLVLLQLGTARAKARDAKRISDVSQLRTSIELYFDDNGGVYPGALTTTNLSPYFSAPTLPVDPVTGALYFYAVNTGPARYHLFTELERRNAAALNGDTDINSTGWTGNALNASVGTTEACATGVNDCIYDVGQQ